ncbi:MAG: HEAT repeat domain-containing protein, partial [Acidobacteria bacterium]|nr:HEAT repeat domain-containing protein [Acidobacteriota bacterium]
MLNPRWRRLIGMVSVLLVWSAARAAGAAQAGSVELWLGELHQARSARNWQRVTKLADQILGVDAANVDATGAKITALLAMRQTAAAVETYDRYVAAVHADDRAFLGEIGRATLWDLARSPGEAAVRPAALERLAREGDAAALADLRALAKSSSRDNTSQQLPANLCLAALGERTSIEWLVARAGEHRTNDTVMILDAAAARQITLPESAVVGLLDDPNPVVRASAVRAAGKTKAYGSIPKLRQLLNDPIPLVRLNAAAGLRALGDVAGERLLAQWLTGEVVELRIGAAEAFVETNSREWIKPMKALLDDENPISRLRAAELLLRTDADSSWRVVVDALRDP